MLIPMRHASMLFGLLLAAACGGGSDTKTTTPTSPTTPTTPATPAAVVTSSVSMKSRAFSPPNIQVAPSAVVTWTNDDNFNHNVTFSGAVGNIGDFSTGAKTLTMPAAPGTYAYTCTLHGGMSGTVVVK